MIRTAFTIEKRRPYDQNRPYDKKHDALTIRTIDFVTIKINSFENTVLNVLPIIIP